MKKIKIFFFNYNIKDEHKKFLLLFILCNSIFILNIIGRKIIKRNQELSKGKIYIKKCFDGELLNNNTKTIFHNPKISAVIPVYNCQNTIKASVRSIQNQNMAYLEIILVNDNSKDNTSIIIQGLAKEDPRIKIINNEKTMATLYSRNIGILHSKGKFIMNLDNDDLFLSADLFDTLYDEAEKGNFDVIGFSAVNSREYNSSILNMKEDLYHDHKDGLTVYQPELSYYAISKNDKYKLNDIGVWGRLTKADIYKEAINNFGINALGEIRNSCFVTWAEDSSMSMAIYKYAKSYKFIKKYGIFHYISETTASNTSKNDLKKYGELFFIDIVFDFGNNNFKGKKYSFQMLQKMIFDKINNLGSEKNVRFLKSILKKMLDCPYISIENKNEIKTKLDLVNSIEII